MTEDLKSEQLKIIRALAGRIDDFYLVGGTALSLFYFDHRESEDLDFFTKIFSPDRVVEVVEFLKKKLAIEVELKSDNLIAANQMKVMIYNAQMDTHVIKIDFVEDALPLINPLEAKEGIKVLSIEDIYLKKIYAVSGFTRGVNNVGQLQFAGNRQRAKDLFDLYYLSNKVLPLSIFTRKYCDQPRKAGVIRWFRSFNRTEMKMDLAEIKTKTRAEFRDIDRHFKQEIDKILEEEVGL